MSAVWGEELEWQFENAAQLWSELEDTLRIPKRPSLEQLDNSFLMYSRICANYLDIYLTNPLDLENALILLLRSVLFKFHSTRMIDLIIKWVKKGKDPSFLYILLSILLLCGQQSPSIFKSYVRWRPVIPFLVNVLDQEIVDTSRVPCNEVSIELRLRAPCAHLLYELARVQKLDSSDLEIFNEQFIDQLFELVERTRAMDDETLNYAIIKLLIALNEQFMVATLPPSHHSKRHHHDRSSHPHTHSNRSSQDTNQEQSAHVPADPTEAKKMNRVLVVLMRRLGASKTFGENLIFMLNRAEDTAEDLCMQLLILKILYLLFTTPGTKEYFYTNDLKVLVDVFVRELSDLPEESESLRHTYLRVLHPLLTSTQLRTLPYKRAHLQRVLRSLTANPHGIREISPSTKRLVDRCLSGEWCIQEDSAKRADGKPAVSLLPSSQPHRVGVNGAQQQGSLDTLNSLAGTLGVDAMAEGTDVEPGADLSKSLDHLSLLDPPNRNGNGYAHRADGRRLSSSTSASSSGRPHPDPSGSFRSHNTHLDEVDNLPLSRAVPQVARSAPIQSSPLAMTAAGKPARRKPPAPPVNRATKGLLRTNTSGAGAGSEDNQRIGSGTDDGGRCSPRQEWETFA
ncbi:Coeffector of mDia Rho GTPase, regulates actin polymerization and cell adhesion turnover [Phaffia rhodozyma]|uniref:Coeffector of mDia Rho GTPase, regulates actin polymerization and cell adhesion turnover n=1 Tax=Phaffia rhodozyma TaxID=264483 RepID=A0A0F7SH28_PHARH|nr:Coeffector of mDia Rho GTPase, regulates actin polymerization and cell adhesion turnover [Phaffia rhodozyma]